MTDINDLRVVCERIETKLEGFNDSFKALSDKVPENAKARMEELEKDSKETLAWKSKMLGIGTVVTLFLSFKDIIIDIFSKGSH